MKRALVALLTIAIILPPLGAAEAYLLPPYKMTDAQLQQPAEETFAEYDAIMASIRGELPIGEVENHRKDHNKRLTSAQVESVRKFQEIKDAYDFWSHVMDLRSKLLAMHPQREDPAVQAEADAFAKAAVQRTYDLSQEYQIPISALIRNWEVNKGKRKKGHCYHYVNDLRKELRKRSWQYFEMHWGEAWPKGVRENNALVIVAAGQPFDTGLAIDLWRRAGRPYWTWVKGDFYPWQDAGDLEIEDQ